MVDVFVVTWLSAFIWASFQASATKYTMTAVFRDVTQQVAVIRYRRFGTTYRSHLLGSNFLSLKMGPTGSPETSERSHRYTLCNSTEKNCSRFCVWYFFDLQLSWCALEATRDGGRCPLCALVRSVLCWVHDVEIVPCRWYILTVRAGHRSEWQAAATDSTYCIYRQFNIQQLYVLPTRCIYVFCVDLRTNSDYFPIQH